MPIGEVVFPKKSRHELPAILKSLQYIFVTREINEEIFNLLEEMFCKQKKKTGRWGMDLWHVLVLAIVRHSSNLDWDNLLHISNNDCLVRQIMGVEATKFTTNKITFEYQNILDNVSILDDSLLTKINEIVAKNGQKLFKKKSQDNAEESLELKTDSYVL